MIPDKDINDFPLTIGDVIRDFMQVPLGMTHILYHYTTRAGLEGILRSGGLRATYRGQMNDKREFAYARDVIAEVFNKIRLRPNLPSLVPRLMDECLANLQRNAADSPKVIQGYCACLTVSRDQMSQWKAYADNGRGFALGFNFFEIHRIQKQRFESGNTWLVCMPVLYDPDKQRDMIGGVVAAAIADLKKFRNECSKRSEDLTAFYHRVLLEAVIMLVTCIDFIKHPDLKDEREMRIVTEASDGTFDARDVEYRASDGVPFLFYDLRDPTTERLPLEEIILGPNAVSRDDISLIERLIEETGLDSPNADRPHIVRSSVASWK